MCACKVPTNSAEMGIQLLAPMQADLPQIIDF